MVALYFGLPGCGKTTILTSLAYKYRKLNKYKHIYTNVHLSIPNVTYIDDKCIGVYDLSNSLILIDEATLFADSRDYKGFSPRLKAFFLLHRHYNSDIVLYTQQWDGVDKKIRVITDRVYYIYKTPLLGRWFSTYYQVPYGILIPSKGKTDAEKYGEIVQGYYKPHWIVRLFAHKVFRPRYYRYFDSWEAPALPPLPNFYKPYAK